MPYGIPPFGEARRGADPALLLSFFGLRVSVFVTVADPTIRYGRSRSRSQQWAYRKVDKRKTRPQAVAGVELGGSLPPSR